MNLSQGERFGQSHFILVKESHKVIHQSRKKSIKIVRRGRGPKVLEVIFKTVFNIGLSQEESTRRVSYRVDPIFVSVYFHQIMEVA